MKPFPPMALVAPPGDLCYNKQKYRSRMNLPIGERAEKERVVVKIQESAENYLEAILVLSNQNGTVRSIDIAAYLQFSKPSVSRAMSLLRQNGYAEMDKDGLITLTPKGLEIAERVYERHRLLSTWLVSLGVSPDTAAEDACRIEHVISRESFDKIKEHVARYQGGGEA